jgi:hypothetical protein
MQADELADRVPQLAGGGRVPELAAVLLDLAPVTPHLLAEVAAAPPEQLVDVADVERDVGRVGVSIAAPPGGAATGRLRQQSGPRRPGIDALEPDARRPRRSVLDCVRDRPARARQMVGVGDGLDARRVVAADEPPLPQPGNPALRVERRDRDDPIAVAHDDYAEADAHRGEVPPREHPRRSAVGTVQADGERVPFVDELGRDRVEVVDDLDVLQFPLNLPRLCRPGADRRAASRITCSLPMGQGLSNKRSSRNAVFHPAR